MESVAVTWSREEEKAFENAIAMHCVEEEVTEDQYMKMASMVPTKSLEEVKKHYQILLEDVMAIESGHVPLPSYNQSKGIIINEPAAAAAAAAAGATSQANKDCPTSGGSGSSEKKPNHGTSGPGSSNGGGGRSGASKAEQERRKGIPWTEEEHRFLLLTSPSFFLSSIFKDLTFTHMSLFYFVC